MRKRKDTICENSYAEIEEVVQQNSMDWDDFKVFLAIVKAGSLNRAAGLLDIVQPTVSRRLARLEKALGVRLFERGPSGPRLTFEGHRVLNAASMAQLSLAQASRSAKAAAPRIEGECRLVMGDGLASYWMPQFLVAFFDRYPNIELKNFVAQEAYGAKNEIFDLNVHYDTPAQADPVAARIATLHFIPFASQSYLRKHGTPRSMEDLHDHRLLNLSLYLMDKGSWSAWWTNRAVSGTSLLTNLSGPLAEAVRRGAGIALLPTYVTLIDEAFVPLDIGMRFQLPIFLSIRRGSAMRWPVRAMADFLKTVVFDRNLMPWFADRYESPSQHWRELFAAIVAQASDLTRYSADPAPQDELELMPPLPAVRAIA